KRQRILVTSHASKALRVVKDHVAPSLRNLCVSVLHGDDDSSKELEESVTGIITYLAKTSAAKLDAEIHQIASERSELVQESDRLRQSLREAALVDYRRGGFQGGEGLSPAAGRRGRGARGAGGWS